MVDEVLYIPSINYGIKNMAILDKVHKINVQDINIIMIHEEFMYNRAERKYSNRKEVCLQTRTHALLFPQCIVFQY